MGEELKSAYELAIERLARRGANAGTPAELSRGQKERIAAVRKEYRARKAELEFSHRREIEDLEQEGDAEKLEKARDLYRRGLEVLDEEEAARITAIRESS